MTKKRIIVIIIILSILSLTFYSYKINATSRGYINPIINKLEGKTLDAKFQTKIKSGNLSTDYNIDKVIKDIDKLELNTLNVPIVIKVDNLTSSNMTVDNESEKRAIELIKKLKGKKINIIFGELGFPKMDKASVAPYDPQISDIINNQEQANCFEAYRRVFENESWNLGFSIFAIGENSVEKRYYPSEESSEIIKKWYSKES